MPGFPVQEGFSLVGLVALAVCRVHAFKKNLKQFQAVYPEDYTVFSDLYRPIGMAGCCIMLGGCLTCCLLLILLAVISTFRPDAACKVGNQLQWDKPFSW